MKDENDNKTVGWVEVKPKTIETELDTEKYCKGCDDYYPESKEFFFGRNSKSGFKFDPICKACYKEKYGRSLIRTNDVSHRYLGVTA